ncbi:MAG TPA: hypothetical protein VKR31_05395 [Rhizomicrobium sp.]|nr:hypothetical protein [Rhizomicrobium sp.]
MKIARLSLLVANTVLWGGFIWLGWSVINSVDDKHMTGYPNVGQFRYYFEFPLIMFFAALLPSAVLWRTRWAALGTTWLITCLLLFLPYACFYTGGV